MDFPPSVAVALAWPPPFFCFFFFYWMGLQGRQFARFLEGKSLPLHALQGTGALHKAGGASCSWRVRERGGGRGNLRAGCTGRRGSVPASCLPMTGLAAVNSEPASLASPAVAAQGGAESGPNTVLQNTTVLGQIAKDNEKNNSKTGPNVELLFSLHTGGKESRIIKTSCANLGSSGNSDKGELQLWLRPLLRFSFTFSLQEDAWPRTSSVRKVTGPRCPWHVSMAFTRFAYRF